MHINIIAGITATLVLGVRADLCALGSINISGNEYCQAVEAIRYSNVGQAGIYNDITSMSSDGTCSSQPFHFSGPLSPLDEEVSLHFRGPIQLKQLAVYALSGKKKRMSSLERRQHQHGKLHKASDTNGDGLEVNDKREVISATINGAVVSWDNNYSGTSTVNPVYVTATIDGKVVSWVNNWFGPTATPSGISVPVTRPIATPTAAPAAANKPSIQADPTPSRSAQASAKIVPTPGGLAQAAYPRPGHTEPTSSPKPSSVYAGVYRRIGYYDSASQTVDNLVFLGNYGGETGGSGVFDHHFGASLAYANNEGTSGAASPQVLNDCVIQSDKEVIVMTGNKCEDGDSCGYVRPGSIAHHGFAGADKMFLMEFSMPHDSESGESDFNADMPAIWMLNAKIPRTLQYGNSRCSCWDSGCGEVDVAEALHSGSKYLKSTIHTNEPAGDSDYFERPTSNTLKLAVIFSSADAAIHIEVLPDNTSFSTQMTSSQIHAICNSNANKAVSHFKIG